VSLTIEINDKPVRDLLKKIEQVGPAGRKIAAEEAAKCTRQHFAALAGSRHRPAAGMTNFYSRAAKATVGRVQGEQVIVSIDALGLALRRYGGTITPKRTKYLAIPAEDNAAAINNSPRRVPGLHFRRNASGNGGRLTDATGRVFYWLVKKSVHQPDPSVLPTADDFDRAITPVIQAHLDRM
jgi:hypothetical protein